MRSRTPPLGDGVTALCSWGHAVQQALEAIKALAPEGGVNAHPVDQGCQTLRLRTVVGFAPLVPVQHQAGALQYAQVLGYRRLRDARTPGQSPPVLFTVAAQPFEDRPARRIAKCPKDVVRCSGH